MIERQASRITSATVSKRSKVRAEAKRQFCGVCATRHATHEIEVVTFHKIEDRLFFTVEVYRVCIICIAGIQRMDGNEYALISIETLEVETIG